MKDLNQLIMEAEIYIKTNQPIIEKRLQVLKKQGKLPEDLEIEDVEDIRFLDSDLQEKIALEILELKRARNESGYKLFTGYHTSPVDLKVGSKINVGEDGNAYFSDQYSLFSRWHTAKHVYLVSADAKFRDEKEPEGIEGRWYSRSPLTILRKWTKEEFIDEHPEARFR